MEIKAKVFLKQGKDEAVKRFHPWVFSGAIKKIEGDVADGDIVTVYTSQNEYLATGHIQNGSIAVRLFDFDNNNMDDKFWVNKFLNAYKLRETLGLTDSKHTNAYRLIHAEGDGLPGLIVDFYNGTAVIQSHSVGMHVIKPTIVKCLQEVYGEKLHAVYDKSADTLAKYYSKDLKDDYLWGKSIENVVLENDNKFFIDWEEGQKTGFFVDQRENRKLLGSYVKDKTVLNTFCYTGGFSVYALRAGAKHVDSLDSSKKAMELTDRNIVLNGFDASKHTSICEDAIDYLKNIKDKYEVIVLDPPAFAKHLDSKHQAIQGYKRINALAIQQIKKGGILFTFSCSQVIDKYAFQSTILAAAIQVGRKVKILHQLSQPADHPVNIFHPEGEYLKGLVVYVE